MDEKLQAIKVLWTEDEAEFHGEHVDFDPVYSYPKPLQMPHPPILVGGVGPSAHGRVLEYGDEWFPTRQNDETLDDLALRISALRKQAQEAGLATPRVSVYRHEPRTDVLRGLEALGVDRCVFSVSGHGEVRGTLEEIAAVMAPFASVPTPIQARA